MSSTGQIVGGIAGGIIGAFAGNPILGAQIGMMAGGYIDPPKGQNTVGPRLEDLTVQTSTYGAELPRLNGTVAVTGNIFWLEGDAIKEHSKTESARRGGKGGGGGPTSTSFSYSATFAIGLAHCTSAPIAGIRRLWLGNRLVYDAGSGDLNSIIASNQQEGVMFKVYRGGDDQAPDPRMQADKGIANVSGYPGRAYIVFYDLDLTAHYNNSLLGVQAKVEVVTSSSPAISNSIIGSLTDNLISGYHYRILGMTFTRLGAEYITTKVLAADSVPVQIGFRRMEFPYHHPENWESVSTPAVGWGYRNNFLFCSQSDDPQLALQKQGHSGISNDTLLRWFYPGGNDGWDDYSSDGRLLYDGLNVVAFDRGDTFLAWTGPSGYVVSVGRGGITATSSAKYTINQLGVSENFVFALEYTFISDNSTTTVYKFDRVTLALLDTYTQPAIGGRGAIEVIDDSTFYTAASKALAGNRLYKWVDGVVVEDYGNILAETVGEKSRLHVVSDAPIFGYLLHFSAYIFNANLRVFYTEIATTTAKLRDVVTDECALVGISSADLDLTELANSDIRGYRHSGSVRAAFEQLQSAFPFDVIQSGYKLKFKSRGAASVLTIPESDLGAHAGNNVPSRFMLTTEMPTQVPAKVTFNFLNADREYDPDEQSAAFTAQDVKNSYTVSLPLVMTPTEALQAADVLLRKEQIERTTAGTFWLPPDDNYRKLEAADIINIVAQGRTHTLRLTKVTQLPDGRIECDGKLTGSAAYTSAAVAQASLALGQATVPLVGSSELLLLDIPRIVSAQDAPGITVGMYGYSSGWPGGVAFRSDDFGETYNSITAFDSKTEVFTVAGLPAAVSPYLIDASTALIVTRAWGGADLSSITEAQLFALGNIAAYGADGRWEIVCFKSVTDNGNGTYTLRDFMRGRYGTEWAMPLHAAGDRLVMLDFDRADFASLPLSAINSISLWRGVTAGASIESDADEAFTYAATNLKPIAPIKFNGSRHPTTLDWTLSAVRRSRTPVEAFSGLPTPIGEAQESYDCEIWNSDYSVLKRTFSGLTSASTDYTAAQQVADFGVEQSTLYVKWYPLSATVGRGYPLQDSIYRYLPLDPYGSQVELLLHMDDTALSDVIGHAVTLNAGAARSATQSAFGGYSAAFGGGGEYLSIPYTSDFAFGSGDFTVEMWVYKTANNPNASRLWSTNGDYYDGISISIDASGNLVAYGSSNNASWNLFSAASIVAVPNGAWKWIVFQRTGGTLDCYFHGTRYTITTGLSTIALMTQTALAHVIGGQAGINRSLNGYVDEVRVTKGVARYSGATITVPSAPFPNP